LPLVMASTNSGTTDDSPRMETIKSNQGGMNA
jgi:hypothetical protein